MPRVGFVVASGADTTRWAAHKQPCDLAPPASQRLYLKYPTEHFLAVRACSGVDPCPFKPPHEQLARLFDEENNSSSSSAIESSSAAARAKARSEVLGSHDRGYIDGVRWRRR